jgi:ABC-type phosphonate transport system ATPase subunit
LTALLAVEELDIEIPLALGTLRPVRGVSFEVERGKTLSIVGESGRDEGLAPPRKTRASTVEGAVAPRRACGAFCAKLRFCAHED